MDVAQRFRANKKEMIKTDMAAENQLILLCYLKNRCEANSLMELSAQCYAESIKTLLREINVYEFTINQWNVVLLYVFRINRRLRTYREIQDCLNQRLGAG